MEITLLDPNQPAWLTRLDELYTAMGGRADVTFFPVHFVQVALPQIGGRVALIEHAGALQAAALLFPRQHTDSSSARSRAFTLRLQCLPGAAPIALDQLAATLAATLDTAVVPYDPSSELHFAASHQLVNGIDIGRPNRDEAETVRLLQQQIWGSSPESLYPADIHSREFGLGTSLVARVAGRTVGFLFGFLKFGGKPLPDDWQQHVAGHLRIESQLLGVLPEQRGARLGFLLKKRQAEQALRAGIQIINWTVDPLQWPNAVLNFGLLRAMAFDFAPDYYRFRNELNRVPASRFGLTWLVNTQRVTRACGLYLDAAADHPSLIDLAAAPAIQRVNDGAQALVEQPTSQQIAIELPADWTTLQHQDLGYALRWRTTTDRLLQRLIGLAPGQYVVTDVGVESSRRYLVAQRSTTALWAQLGDQSLPPQQIVDKGERSY